MLTKEAPWRPCKWMKNTKHKIWLLTPRIQRGARGMCVWNLELKFQIKAKLCPGNQVSTRPSANTVLIRLWPVTRNILAIYMYIQSNIWPSVGAGEVDSPSVSFSLAGSSSPSDNALCLAIHADLILGLRPVNERRRYKVTPSLIGWAQT